jgi:hypothetical protein
MRFVFVRCIATFFVCDETDAVGPWSCYRTSGADGVVLFGSTVFMEFGIRVGTIMYHYHGVQVELKLKLLLH